MHTRKVFSLAVSVFILASMAQAITGCGDEQTYSDVSVQDVVTGLNLQDDPDNEAGQYLSESGDCEVYRRPWQAFG